MDMMVLMPLLLVVVGAAAVLVYVGMRAQSQTISIEERLATFAETPASLEEIEMSLPFRERVLAPLVFRLARVASRFTPRSNVAKIRQKLIEAGSPAKLGINEFLGIRLLLMGALGGLFFVFLAVSGSQLLALVAIPLAVGVLGYMIPGIWLDRKIKERKRSIQLALPDAIDLLTISVEAGLGFDPALSRVAEKWDNVLTLEFRRLLSEMRMGKSRREAMREMVTRTNVDDLNVFIASIIQADQLGVSISQVLRVQSRQMRIRRRQRAEELAHKAPIKMLFPMVFLIFPALYVVILGPAVPQIMNSATF
jgi:tight adherence protein C